jgi:hypothetical protein
MRSYRASRGSRVRNSNDQSDLSFKALGQSGPLQLGCSQLSLEIAQSPLDLNQHRITRTGKDHVSGASVRRRRYRNLQAHLP